MPAFCAGGRCSWYTQPLMNDLIAARQPDVIVPPVASMSYSIGVFELCPRVFTHSWYAEAPSLVPWLYAVVEFRLISSTVTPRSGLHLLNRELPRWFGR